jgi:APA family basic amino acid/polyamine antiporter
MKVKAGGFELKREIGLLEATFYGVGIILGAGIYVLIGEGAGIAGNMLWLSFGIAALVALFTAFSYAELSSMFPKEAAEYTYTRNAFKRPRFAFTIQWILIVAGVISAATVALGFGGYLTALLGSGSPIIAGLALVVGCSLINYTVARVYSAL